MIESEFDALPALFFANGKILSLNISKIHLK